MRGVRGSQSGKMNPFEAVLVVLALSICSNAEIVFSDADEDLLKTIRAKCAASEKIDPALIPRVDSADFPTYDEVKCYPYCVFSTFGIMTKTGEFDLEFLRVHIPEEQHQVYLPVVNECSKTKATESCQRGYESYKCYSAQAYA
ncbi:PREDICTED: general odorant-binding protein 69a-like [Nicrophorus vespilloides]|uniref:General odorant-binding protein 69a-like n=1 Tax=Nicrophorus vespilloides TaxID=110193 RepID=A0ABM1N881_NICVS|nr:PREDICTED: general odorant-binding protein 69a-like [Nicrophorus vespilloides]